MRMFVAFRTKNHVPLAEKPVRQSLVRRTYRALERVQPWPSENTVSDLRWVPSEGRVGIIWRSNEPPSTPEREGWIGNKSRAWAWTGVLGSEVYENLRRTSVQSLPLDRVWAGIGSFALIGATPHSIVGVTNQHRSEALYWKETADEVLLSNSAALLSLIGDGAEPIYSRLGIAGFIMHALPFTETLPFADVRVVPAAAQIASNEASDVSFDYDSPEVSDEIGIETVSDNIAHGLVEYAKVLTRGAGDVSAAITGGKDSRLVVAALHAAGIKFDTYTNGLPESGEGVVGRAVASALGVPHRLGIPAMRRSASGGMVVVGRPEQQAWSTLRATGGMGNAYTALPDPAGRHISVAERANFGGQGGEIVRGGFARYFKNDSPTVELGIALLRKTWLNNAYVLNGLAVEAVEADARGLFSAIDDDPSRALFEGYVTNRTGRWLATMRHGESVIHSHTTLLINNQMVRECRRLPSPKLLGERLAHSVMARLAPSVVDMPFFRDRWAFEMSEPCPEYKPESWQARAPYAAHDQPRATFNWRAVRSNDLSSFFRDYILSSPQSLLFDVVDRDAVERMLGGWRYHAPLAWALFSAQYMLSNDWLGEAPKGDRRVEIKVPE